jgi:hypothetical protein
MLTPKLIRDKDTENCIFCGRPTNSGEHLFSRWTHKYLPPRAKGRAMSAVSVEYADGRAVHDNRKMPGQMRDWKINCVCGGTRSSCNGGWMKDIDDAAKPIMLPLILGKETRLTPNQQRVVATWAVLKTTVANHNAVSRDHLQIMYDQHVPPPESWGVWIGHYERQSWDGEWLTRLFTVLPNDVYQAMQSPYVDHSNGSSTTFVVNKPFVVVGQTPDVHFGHRWNFDGHAPLMSKLRRIWPPVREASIRWSPATLTDAEAIYATDALINGVKRVAKELLEQGLLGKAA